MEDVSIGARIQCPVCKKQFILQDRGLWRYKSQKGNTVIYYCSWTCYRREQRVQEEKYGKGKYKCRCCGEIKELPDMLSKTQCWDCNDKRYIEGGRKKRKRRKEQSNG